MMLNAPLFLLSLGASPFHLGLLATLSSLGSTSRLLGARAMPYLGKARMLCLGRLLASGCPLLLIPVALCWADATNSGVWMAIGFLALRQIVMQMGGSAWWPLVQDNTFGASLTDFITRQKITQRLVSLGVPLAAGWYLGSQPSASRFAAPFALVAVIGATGAWVARGISERPLPRPTERYWHRVRGVLQIPAVRGYGLCFGVVHFANAAVVPFWVVVLRDRGMPVNHYVWLTALAALGELLPLYLWGRLVEAHGCRAVLTVTLGLLGLAAPLWLTLPTETAPLVVWAAVFYFLWGAVGGGWGFGETRAMIDAVPDDYQAEGFAVMMFTKSVAAALGAFLGGLAFDWATTLPVRAGAAQPTLIYLASLQFLLLGGWVLCRHLKGYDDQLSLSELLQRAVRR